MTAPNETTWPAASRGRARSEADDMENEPELDAADELERIEDEPALLLDDDDSSPGDRRRDPLRKA